MSDSFALPLDPTAGMMFFAGPDEEQAFGKTPANVTNNFIAEAKQNIAAGPSATPTEVTSLRDSHPETPVVLPGRSAADPTTTNKRKRFSTFGVTNTGEHFGSNTKQAAETSPTTAPTLIPFSSPFELPAPKKRKRQSGKKATNARVIPRSLDECDAADKELITLREAGNEWKTIRARWVEMTGEQTATSTLPNRYARLKSNFTVIKEEDNGHLIAAKREVEESFENQKWELIARVVQDKGGENYAGVVLKRQYKKLMVSAGALPPPGVQDADFEIDLPDEDGE